MRSFLKDPKSYGTRRFHGRPRSLSVRDERRLLRAASNSPKSAKQLKMELQLPISASRTRAYLNNASNLRHKKPQRAPVLSQKHKDHRLEWAKKHLRWNFVEWSNVVFSDEKRFCNDGPDGFMSYWHDIRKEETLLSRRQNGGGGLMVWGAFAMHGRCELAIMAGRQKTEDYLRIMESHLLPFADENMPITWTYQQDNAPIHVSVKAKSWFEEQHIRLMDWPARSPDLNPMENVWGWLSRAVYANNRQFVSTSELKDCIFDNWSKMPQELVTKLVTSMHNRAVAVIERRGLTIDY